MLPSTFFLSGLVKVSEKRRHQCQGPRGGGRDLNCFSFQGHLRSPEYLCKGKGHTFGGSQPFSHTPQRSGLYNPENGERGVGWGDRGPSRAQGCEFPREVWGPLRKILCSVTLVASTYPNKAKERSVHFFTNSKAIEPDLL